MVFKILFSNIVNFRKVSNKNTTYPDILIDAIIERTIITFIYHHETAGFHIAFVAAFQCMGW